MNNIMRMSRKSALLIICIVIISISISIQSNNIDVFANNYNKMSQYNNMLLEENFEDDNVIVVLNSKASKINKIHSAKHFDGIDVESITDLTKREHNFKSKNNNFKQILQIHLKEKGKENVLKAISYLVNLDGVFSAEPNYIFENTADSNDPSYINDVLWGLNGTNGIDVENAWNFTTGSNAIRVGIIDTGISNHVDLNENLATGIDTFNNNNITSDDTDLHGTHVAGTIGAVGNNGTGVVGVNWNVTLVPLQAANSDNKFNASDVIEAIEWAQDRWETNERISIINYSASGFGLSTAIRTAVSEYSGLFIWAAGNESVDIDQRVAIHGSFNLDNLISVGGLNNDGTRRATSNYSTNNTNVHIYAPGSEILSTFSTYCCNSYNYTFNDGTRLCELPEYIAIMVIDCSEEYGLSMEYIDEHFSDIITFKDGIKRDPAECKISLHGSNGYHYMSGTSMATPYVTGVAALLLSLDEELTTVQLKQAILQSAENINITIPDGSTQNVKKLNAYNAVKYVLSNYSETMTLGTNTQSLSQYVDSSSTFFDEKNYFAKLDVDDSLKCNFTVSSTSPLEITLYDSNFNEMDISINQTNGGATNGFVQQLPIGEYYLKVNFTNENASGTIATTIACEHFHNPLLWMYLNSSFHRGRCSCGEWIQKAHVIDASQVVNFKAPCLECHALLDLRDDSVGGVLSIGRESANGSYILPNGVIVLVEEDVDAYFAGTLIFYDGDSDLLTQ